MRFTKPAIARLSLPAGKNELILFDDTLPGFGIRLRSGGKRTWIVQYRIGTKQRRITIGSLAVMDLDRARKEAKIKLSEVGLAIDPQAKKNQKLAAAAITLGSQVATYLAIKAVRLKPRSFVETERHLNRDWRALHDQPLVDIGRADIASHLAVLARSNGLISADRARASLSAFYTWAMREGLVPTNPVIATNRPGIAETRDRVLTDGELADVWHACGDDEYGRIVKLLLLTGQRRDEVAGMEYRELDLTGALWLLPAARTKNGRPHQVPVSDQAVAILAGHPRRERDLLFGAGAKGFSGWSKAKVTLDQRILADREKRGASPMPPWRLHDLRRTVATRLADLGTAPHIVEAVLNHISGARAGVAGVYNRALYGPEKRQALTMWGSHVEALVNGTAGNVVALRRA